MRYSKQRVCWAYRRIFGLILFTLFRTNDNPSTPALSAQQAEGTSEANAEFMVRFYEELSKPGMTKAQAVLKAQLALLKDYGYTTPHIWGTYVLVGNWL